jgi:hypothetical protein
VLLYINGIIFVAAAITDSSTFALVTYDILCAYEGTLVGSSVYTGGIDMTTTTSSFYMGRLLDLSSLYAGVIDEVHSHSLYMAHVISIIIESFSFCDGE